MGLWCRSEEVALVTMEEWDRDLIIFLLKVINYHWWSSFRTAYNISTMGIQSQNYEHVFKTATISECNSQGQLEKDFLSSLDSDCNLFVCNIFNVKALTQGKIDLDQCFVPAHETFTTKQLPFLCPLLNRELFEGEEVQGKIGKLKFIIEYCVYLGIKRVALKWNVLKSNQILQNLKKIEKYFRKGKLTLLIIVQIGGKDQLQQQQSWKNFIHFRQALLYETNIELVVQISANLPQKRIIKRWMGQHVVFLSIKQQTFILNNKGYPVLSAAHQQVAKQFMRRHVNLAIHHQNLSTTQQKQPYFKYLAFVLQKLVKTFTKRDIQAQGLLDYLQAPLQPYIDNLDAEIYDIFQFDAVKYNEYQLSFCAALQTFKEDRVIVCYYVGSGKGLILSKMMSACKSTGKKIKVYCIDKNPYPLQTLRRRIQRNKWTKMVQVVEADIKEYVMPEHPDIIFSELLGGLGDNELEPECIKWAEKNATEKTIIIPQKYTAFIRPVSCHTLHKQISEQERESYFTVNFGLAYSPFKSLPIWSFSHPLDEKDDLTRHASLEWTVQQDLVLHGFQGTFDCNLFDKAYFSIVPQTLTKDFYSWFPIYFSFKKEECLMRGQSIKIEIDRKSTHQKVWYQWNYSIISETQIVRKQSLWHNLQGRYAIHLTQE